MKKIFLVFIIFSLLVLVWCKSNNIENKEDTSTDKSKVIYNSTECKPNMKLWINKTYNFEVCIPKDWWELSEYSWNVSSDLSIYDNTGIIWNWVDSEELSTVVISNKEDLLWKYDQEVMLWNKKIIKSYFINNEWKKEFLEYKYIIKVWKNQYYLFSFSKQTKEIKDIIKSIKLLKNF